MIDGSMNLESKSTASAGSGPSSHGFEPCQQSLTRRKPRATVRAKALACRTALRVVRESVHTTQDSETGARRSPGDPLASTQRFRWLHLARLSRPFKSVRTSPCSSFPRPRPWGRQHLSPAGLARTGKYSPSNHGSIGVLGKVLVPKQGAARLGTGDLLALSLALALLMGVLNFNG